MDEVREAFSTGSLDQATIAGLSNVDLDAATSVLLDTFEQLEVARLEFNAVDHAFKPGRVTIIDKPVETGLTLAMVQPLLDALNLAELRIQDVLTQRGAIAVSGFRTPKQWLASMAPDLYAASTTRYQRLREGIEVRAPSFQETGEYRRFLDVLMDPLVQSIIDGIRSGFYEHGLVELCRTFEVEPWRTGTGCYVPSNESAYYAIEGQPIPSAGMPTAAQTGWSAP